MCFLLKVQGRLNCLPIFSQCKLHNSEVAINRNNLCAFESCLWQLHRALSLFLVCLCLWLFQVFLSLDTEDPNFDPWGCPEDLPSSALTVGDFK